MITPVSEASKLYHTLRQKGTYTLRHDGSIDVRHILHLEFRLEGLRRICLGVPAVLVAVQVVPRIIQTDARGLIAGQQLALGNRL